ncbi:LOW QUALITY PROTEIN: Putative pinin desmosome-associated protein [Gryllus bimaculatus]|nr:LOW QUALITY PROTEIN: Putative pinin desmosome-associated protein [Gryllus bimaculatus]
MTTEIMKSFGALQDELEKAKDNLKAMDEHIKKLTGRDPSDVQLRPGMKRPPNAPEEFRGRGRGFPLMRGRPGARPEEEEPPAAKKRPGDTRTVFSRLSGPPVPKRGGDSDVEDELPNKPAVSSRVIATPKEPPSRQEAMAAQSSDQRSYERNRRMFGALLGTLQKFRQEETRMREKEEKRAKVERKLEENAKREKEELKRERQELFLERKRKQAEIRKIELKMLRIKEQDEWEAKHRHLLNFIQTRTKPHIFYLPKTHNVKTEERLVASQKVVAKMIEKKRAEVRQELEAIERRGRWRQGLGDIEPGQHSDEEPPMDLGDKENRLGGPQDPSAMEVSEETDLHQDDGVSLEGGVSAAAAATLATGTASSSSPSGTAAATATTAGSGHARGGSGGESERGGDARPLGRRRRRRAAAGPRARAGAPVPAPALASAPAPAAAADAAAAPPTGRRRRFGDEEEEEERRVGGSPLPPPARPAPSRCPSGRRDVAPPPRQRPFETRTSRTPARRRRRRHCTGVGLARPRRRRRRGCQRRRRDARGRRPGRRRGGGGGDDDLFLLLLLFYFGPLPPPTPPFL